MAHTRTQQHLPQIIVWKITGPDDEIDNAWKGKLDGTSNEIASVGQDGKELSAEQIFDTKKVPPWLEQITFRGLLVSMLMGIMFSIIVMKLNLTTGVIPSLNVSAGLLGFFFIRTWTKLMEKAGLLTTPFTRQENTVIQTCVVACYGIAFSGGFGSYLLGMSRQAYNQAGADTPGNDVHDTKNPSLGWIIGFLLTVSFLGLFALVPLRKTTDLSKRYSYGYSY